MRAITVCLALVLLSLVRLSSGADDFPAAATQPTAAEWDALGKDLGIGGGGTVKNGVYTVSVLRHDLEIRTDDGEIPAGLLKHEFQFYRCDCGKMNVVGQFAVVEYESNDVIDALRAGMMKVASVAPMFQGEHPRMLVVRFQGGGGSQQLAKTLRAALEWTGEARMAPAPAPATRRAE